ncbi:type II toxin-antitoxin system Phd/YefM family antitoxin [Escherichia albertii]|nr:type II toxin-antitoxin system Phd/YefM family antitoxin [Escherichia albertii]
MQTYTSTQARANIATVLDTALNGEPVEITRRDGSSAVLISMAGTLAVYLHHADDNCSGKF